MRDLRPDGGGAATVELREVHMNCGRLNLSNTIDGMGAVCLSSAGRFFGRSHPRTRGR